MAEGEGEAKDKAKEEDRFNRDATNAIYCSPLSGSVAPALNPLRAPTLVVVDVILQGASLAFAPQNN